MFPSKCSSIHIMESVELQGWVAAGSWGSSGPQIRGSHCPGPVVAPGSDPPAGYGPGSVVWPL